jgi:uncharacterized spore protein YtfJ
MSTSHMDLVAGRRENFLTSLAETIGSKANSASVFGDPIASDGTIIVPVARARWGFGGGSGGGHDPQQTARQEGFGGGGGMVVKPVGYLAIRDGEVEYREIDRTRNLVTAAIVGMLLAAIFRRRRRERP